jgi:hypothetical protein
VEILDAAAEEQLVAGPPRTLLWEPQPGPQTLLVQCPVFEVFYGGARGGGKTEGSIGDWLLHANLYGENASGLFVRRTLIQLKDVIKRTHRRFPKIGARYNVQEKEWTFPNGAKLRFAYLERDADAENYQGHEFTRIYVEEATNFPSGETIAKLRACVRSTAGVQCGIRLTGNPGGPGHHWVKERYIKHGAYNVVTETEIFDLPDGSSRTATLDRVFIPAKISDNPKLLQNDPGYLMRLRQSGSAALVKAWLEGLWDSIEGGFFTEFSETLHVVHGNQAIPRHLTRFRAMDWGSARPFSIGWYAISDGKSLLGPLGDKMPRGALYKFQEWYGMIPGQPNKGIKLSANLVGRGVLARELPGQTTTYGVADPSIFANNGGPSIGEMMLVEGCYWLRADNARQPGWEQIRKRLSADPPLLYFNEDCDDTIRTLPFLQHDEKDLEDLDTEAEDHAADETRYACMSRALVGDKPPEEVSSFPKSPGEMTINELIARQKRKDAEPVY